MNYKVVDLNTYYRKGVFHHFSKDCKCSVSITNKIDVTELYEYSKKTGTKFYINVLYLISKVLNSREDYKMAYLYKENKVIVYDEINPTQYIFHEDTETCTPVYTKYYEDYKTFYKECSKDIEKAKETREYGLDSENHPNWFDASYISWLSYDSLNVELPDGYLYFMPIINWGKFNKEDNKLMMPVTVRMNHAVADGYLVSKVFLLLQDEIDKIASANY
ncbi:MAG: CatA-like O-acetyltransferase, family 3 [Clostridiaceae bacterium]|nr:CatA-like O-acetyltransferase, family 3 [Clostridiaceae bacterium]